MALDPLFMLPTLTLPRWYDLHTHFRQGDGVKSYIADHLAMGCAGALAMPNTRPPVASVSGANTERSWSIETYRNDLLAAGADAFDQLIVPLYLTSETTPAMIEEGARSGLLKACKYYPPHGTTNAEHGVGLERWIGSDVFRAMESHGIVLCLHGEEHGLAGSAYFDVHQTAESYFYENRMPKLREIHPDLRLVCEHITTEVAVRFVTESTGDVAATVTPQHLLFTVGHLIQGLRYHLYCLPVVKFERDRAALREAVTEAGQTRFFAGTDSAPHSAKVTPCGCAAGCYTGGCAPQLYAMAFEQSGVDLSGGAGKNAFERFLCENGPTFYGFEPSAETFTMLRAPSSGENREIHEDGVVPLPAGMEMDLDWTIQPRDSR